MANLALWVDAGEGVTAGGHPAAAAKEVWGWNDLSGNGRNLYWSDHVPGPTHVPAAVNGQPVMRFTGVERLKFPTLSLTNFTVFACYRFPAITKDKHFLIAGSGQGIYTGGTAPHIGYGAWNHFTTQWLVTTANNYTFGVVTVQNNKDLGQAMVYRNGKAQSLESSQSLDALTLGWLGGRPEGPAENFVGDLAEILVYSSALSNDDRIMLENLLMSKYGLTGNPNPITTDLRNPSGFRVSVARGKMLLSFAQTGDRTVSLYDNKGTRLQTVRSMDAILVLPSERPAGIYLLGIREADGRQIFQKVLMQ